MSTPETDFRELALSALGRATVPLTWLELAKLAGVDEISSAYLEFVAALRELVVSGKAIKRGGPAGELFSLASRLPRADDNRPGRLGKALGLLRIRHGLSREQAALKLGWPCARVVKLEESPDDVQKLGELRAYARLFRRDLVVTFGDASCED